MTLLNIFKQFNWVDILAIILLFRIGYIAIKNGLSVELFKLLGTILAIYLSLHYYTLFSGWLVRADAKPATVAFLNLTSFLVLAILGYLVFLLLRVIFYRFIKMEAVPRLNKWGGFVLGILRGFLLTGLIVFMLVASNIDYLKSCVKDSYLGRYLFKVAPKTYACLWNGFASKFMTKEKFNKTVLKLKEDLAK